ncbi:hypothetical protein M422DRAFT_42397 [Sphaerobolus stellatus SS14]|nr:hypothetical protein M422DRAFT_42397 [Sphaerobolus stellatus SS14]
MEKSEPLFRWLVDEKDSLQTPGPTDQPFIQAYKELWENPVGECYWENILQSGRPLSLAVSQKAATRKSVIYRLEELSLWDEEHLVEKVLDLRRWNFDQADYPSNIIMRRDYVVSYRNMVVKNKDEKKRESLMVVGQPGSGISIFLLVCFLWNLMVARTTLFAINESRWILAHRNGIYFLQSDVFIDLPRILFQFGDIEILSQEGMILYEVSQAQRTVEVDTPIFRKYWQMICVFPPHLQQQGVGFKMGWNARTHVLEPPSLTEILISLREDALTKPSSPSLEEKELSRDMRACLAFELFGSTFSIPPPGLWRLFPRWEGEIYEDFHQHLQYLVTLYPGLDTSGQRCRSAISGTISTDHLLNVIAIIWQTPLGLDLTYHLRRLSDFQDIHRPYLLFLCRGINKHLVECAEFLEVNLLGDQTTTDEALCFSSVHSINDLLDSEADPPEGHLYTFSNDDGPRFIQAVGCMNEHFYVFYVSTSQRQELTDKTLDELAYRGGIPTPTAEKPWRFVHVFPSEIVKLKGFPPASVIRSTQGGKDWSNLLRQYGMPVTTASLFSPAWWDQGVPSSTELERMLRPPASFYSADSDI